MFGAELLRDGKVIGHHFFNQTLNDVRYLNIFQNDVTFPRKFIFASKRHNVVSTRLCTSILRTNSTELS